MMCMACGRSLKGTESIQRGYGPVCYQKMYPDKVKTRRSSDNYSFADDSNYKVPGQMELKDFIEMQER